MKCRLVWLALTCLDCWLDELAGVTSHGLNRLDVVQQAGSLSGYNLDDTAINKTKSQLGQIKILVGLLVFVRFFGVGFSEFYLPLSSRCIFSTVFSSTV